MSRFSIPTQYPHRANSFTGVKTLSLGVGLPYLQQGNYEKLLAKIKE